jgi:hypothetical protein
LCNPRIAGRILITFDIAVFHEELSSLFHFPLAETCLTAPLHEDLPANLSKYLSEIIIFGIVIVRKKEHTHDGRGSIFGRDKRFFFSTASKPALGPNQTPI